MTHSWRWSALVRVGLALELGSTALGTNAHLAASLGPKYVQTYVNEHFGHMFGAAACAVLVPNTKPWVDPPTPLQDPRQEGRGPLYSI
jgi:hypothetical protein